MIQMIMIISILEKQNYNEILEERMNKILKILNEIDYKNLIYILKLEIRKIQ